MKLEKAVSNSIPEKFEYLRGGVFINVAPKEVTIVNNSTNESIVMYEYYQYFTMETNEVILEKKYISLMCKVYKEYLTETGWIWEKYNRNVLVLKDMTSEEFSLKYTDIISKQEEYRGLINELETQLEASNG